MARMLYRIAELCAARSRTVIAVWALILVAVGAFAALGPSRVVDHFDIPGTESDAAQTTLRDHFGKPAPTTLGEGATRLVAVAPDRIDPVAVDVAAAPAVRAAGVASVTPAEAGISPDGRAAFVDVDFVGDPQQAPQSARDSISRAAELLRDQGLEVHVTGGPFYEAPSFVGVAEAVGVAVALLVLVIMLGSLLAAGVPLAIALVGVGVGGVVVASTLFDASSATLALSLMLALAVGIDYSLFVLTRHRDQLAAGMPRTESICRAQATSGSAVVFAGATVIIALCGLAIAGIPFLTGMGVAAAACVLVAVLLTLTLTPAVMELLGDRLRPAPSRGRRGGARGRWIGAITRRPTVIVLLGVTVMAVLALPATQMRLGVPNAGQEAEGTTARDAYDVIADHYPEGLNGPFVVVVSDGAGRRLDRETVAAVHDAAGATFGVAVASPPVVSEDGRAAQFYAVPTSGPSARATEDLAERMRDRYRILAERHDVRIQLTGETVMAIDIGAKLAEKLPLFLAFIVILSVILLLIAFRSVLIPVTAAAGFLLSLAATLGVTTAVYQWGWAGEFLNVHSPAPILAFLPIIVIGVLFGLAMDYQVFLVSRMHEEWSRGGDAAAAVINGYQASCRVVFAAAVIMISVFSSFLFSHNTMVAPIGLALGVGIIVDALLVRLVLLPAVMRLLGRYAWWLPGWLDRLLPAVDIEGHELDEEQHGGARVAASA